MSDGAASLRRALVLSQSFCFWNFSRNRIITIIAFDVYRKFWENSSIFIFMSVVVNHELFNKSYKMAFFQHCNHKDKLVLLFCFWCRNISISLLATLSLESFQRIQPFSLLQQMILSLCRIKAINLFGPRIHIMEWSYLNISSPLMFTARDKLRYLSYFSVCYSILHWWFQEDFGECQQC